MYNELLNKYMSNKQKINTIYTHNTMYNELLNKYMSNEQKINMIYTHTIQRIAYC